MMGIAFEYRQSIFCLWISGTKYSDRHSCWQIAGMACESSHRTEELAHENTRNS